MRSFSAKKAGSALHGVAARALVLLVVMGAVGCLGGARVTDEYAEAVLSPLPAGHGRIYVYVAGSANNRYRVAVSHYSGVVGRREYTAFTLPAGQYRVRIGNRVELVDLRAGDESVVFYPDRRAGMPAVGVFPAESMTGILSQGTMVWNTWMSGGAQQ